MKVKEVAGLTGVSVRTLHHYDAIGLLVPDQLTEAGYRLYSDENLAMLQQILSFKELGFPLKKIKELLENPSFDRQEALVLQREMLMEKRNHLGEMIATIEKTIQYEKGDYSMTNEEKFIGFDFSQNRYEQEARDHWGDQAVDASNEKAKKFGTEFQEDMNRIYFKLAERRHLSPETDEAQEAIGEWFDLLNKMGNYSLEAFAGLGEMYGTDKRFTDNIDQFGEGLALFMRDAMTVYANNRK